MSQTTNLKLFKHDNPSTNTNPFDVKQALNDNLDKIDKAVGDLKDNFEENNTNLDTRLTKTETNITNIQKEQSTQNENIEKNSTAIEKNAENIEKNTTDITALQEENANLKAQIPTGTAEGEEISLQDSAEMELVDFGLQGNSKQESTQGLQILEDTNEGTKGWNMSIQNGAFEMAEYVNLSDGIKECKFKCTENSSGYKVFYRNSNNSKLKNNTKYTLQLDFLANKECFLYAAIQTTAGNYRFIDFIGKSYKTPGQWQTMKMVATSNDEDLSKSQKIYLSIDKIETIDDYFTIKNPILAEGDYADTDLNWEKYTGITRAPNLDYPQEVKAVADSGNVNITNSNANLFEETSNTKFYNTSYIELVKGNFYLEPNVNYRVSFDTNNNGGKVYINEYAFGKWGEATCDGKRHTIISNSKFNTPKYLKTTAILKSGLDVEENYDITNVKLEKDTGVNTDFLEHKGKTYEIPTQRPLYKVKYNDDVIRDCFIYKDGKWYEQHNIGVFDLSKTTWNVGSVQAGTDIKTKRWGSNNKTGGFDFDKYTLSNYFNNNLHSGMYSTDSVGFNLESDRVYIRLPVEVAKTVEEVQAFWQEKAKTQLPIIVYRITQPVLLECIEEQTAILEQIIKDGTYKGITHFYCTDNLKPDMNVKYYKDLETLFNKQAELESTLNNVQAQLLNL